MFNRKKIVVLIASATSLTLTACGGSGSSGGGHSVNLEDESAKTIMISRVPTVPTNGGVSHPVLLNVDNNTGKKLTFVDSKIMNSHNQSTLARVLDKASRAVGGTGYNSYVSTNDCKTLEDKATCTLSVTPDAADGSTIVQLSFKDDSGKVYNTAQLVNYSSTVASQNGFILNTDNLEEVRSTNDYSITIPFIADDDYKSISITSDILALSQSFDCNGQVSKGAACSATIKLPAAPKAGYANSITLRGETVDGRINTRTFSARAFFEDRPSLVMTNGPVHLVADNTSTTENVSIFVVNNGTQVANGIDDRHTAISTEFEGVIQQVSAGENPVTSLVKSYATGAACNFTGAITGSIGHTAPVGGYCTVNFGFDQANKEQNGHDEYRIDYNGENGAYTTKTTTIYYTGLSGIDPNCPSCQRPYNYTITGSFDFTDTKTNRPKSNTVRINNNGLEELNQLQVALPTLPSTFIVDRNSCGTPASPINLPSGQSCEVQLTYTPNVDTPFNSAVATVSATRADGTAFSGSTKTISINYSAQQNPVLQPGLILSNSGTKFELPLNTPRTLSYDLIVQSNGAATPTEVTGITTPVALKPHSSFLDISFPATVQNPNGGAPLTNKFAGVNGFTFDGNWNTTPGQNVSLQGAEYGILTYTYGDATTGITAAEADTLVHQFNLASSTNPPTFTLGYEASDDTADVTDPTVIGTIDENGGGLTNGGTFVLTKGNKLKLEVEYKAPTGSPLTNLLIDDSALPYGFMVDPAPIAGATKCRTTSTSGAPTAGSTLGATVAAGQSCKVRYTFIDDAIGSANTYTIGTQNTAMRTFKNPPYTITTANGVKRVQPSGEFRFMVKPFAELATQVNRIGTTNSYEAIFYITAYGAHNLAGMTNAGITITPIQNFNPNVTVSQPCTINATIPLAPQGLDANNQPQANTKFCKITFTLADPSQSGRVNFRYSSTTDGLYNAVIRNVTMQ